jgi:hypothetical protein
MKYFSIITLIWISFQVSGQHISKSDLLGCWTESIEENTQGSNVFIYRPCDYKVFPPYRFRFKMDLKSDSKCSWLVLASDDGHYMVDGTWTFNEETNELKLYNMEGEEFWKYIIAEVNDTILRIKKSSITSR